MRVETFDKPLIVSSCYRTPSNSNQENDNLANSINNLSKKFKAYPQIIGGDFNLPDINWESYTITDTHNTRELNEKYLEVFDINNLTQIVDFPTRKQNTLDLLLTNRPKLVDSCESAPGFGDHQ